MTLRLLDLAEGWLTEAKVKINAALEYLDGLQASVTAEIAAAITALKATANTWTAAQTIALTAASTALTLRSTDDGSTQGPDILFDRDSPSPAANDLLSVLTFRGNDDGGNNAAYVQLIVRIIDPTDTNEDGQFTVRTLRASANSDWRFESGVLYHSTQTLPSNNGEIAAAAYKVGANQVVGARITGWAAATNTKSKATFDTTTVTTAQLAQRVGQLIDDLMSHGVIGA